MRPTGSGGRNVFTSSGWITNSPSGLRQSEAIFARNLFGATPAEAVKRSSSRICSRMVFATRVAVGKPFCSRLHQGMPHQEIAARSGLCVVERFLAPSEKRPGIEGNQEA